MKKIILLLACFAIVMKVSAQDNGEFKTRESTSKKEAAKKEKKKKEAGSDERAFGQGKLVITAGAGFPNLYKPLYKGLIQTSSAFLSILDYNNEVYSYSAKSTGPFFLKGDYGVTDLIGLGLNVGYFNTTVTETVDYQYGEYNSSTSSYQYVNYQDVNTYYHSSLSFGARINFHFGKREKLDTYAGVGLGYSLNQNTFSTSSNNPHVYIYPPYYGRGSQLYFGIAFGMRYYFTPNIGIYGEVGFDKWSLAQGGLAVKF